jgi:hypothetical protein
MGRVPVFVGMERTKTGWLLWLGWEAGAGGAACPSSSPLMMDEADSLERLPVTRTARAFGAVAQFD